jgi:hypothetical protein
MQVEVVALISLHRQFSSLAFMIVEESGKRAVAIARLYMKCCVPTIM